MRIDQPTIEDLSLCPTAVTNQSDNFTSVAKAKEIITLTQVEYDAIGDGNRLDAIYAIPE